MIKIFSEYPAHFYGPEIFALKSYLESKEDIVMDILDSSQVHFRKDLYDLHYRVMGFSPIWQHGGTPEFHDYASLSTGNYPWLKNGIKRWFSKKPVIRSFLSQYVKDEMAFKDNVPSILRDMGVPEEFFSFPADSEKKVYELCYVGSINKARGTDHLLSAVEKSDRTILMIGEPELEIYSKFKNNPRIQFAGRLSRIDVMKGMASCSFGINYTPNIYPFSAQTSTKVIEYCALGMKVISNRYAWVEAFQRETGGRFLMFDDLADLDFSSIDNFDFFKPDVSAMSWPNVFEKSGIYMKIKEWSCAR